MDVESMWLLVLAVAITIPPSNSVMQIQIHVIPDVIETVIYCYF
jgi:hypothetical protein